MKPRVLWVIAVLVIADTVWAATPFEAVVLPEATYAEGVYEVPPVSIPTGYTIGYIKLARALWTNAATRVDWVIYLSQDDGVTWGDPPMAAGGSTGGVFIDQRTGLPFPHSLIGASMPQADNPLRKVKATFTVSGGSVTTTLSAGMR
jgi:hypothetical protein